MMVGTVVSVIIPVYNAEPFLRETLTSVLEQTYRNIEIILIDDDSTDGSYNLAKEYNVPNIIVKKNTGKGACAARNYGFELSSGDYIQYLDADDILSPDKIEKQVVELVERRDGYMANCSWVRFYESTHAVKWKKQVIDKDYDDPSKWLADSWLGKGMGQTSIWLTPRKLIESAGTWNDTLQLNQDGEFFCRVLLKSRGICFVNDCGVYYRSGSIDSISKSKLYSRDKAESLLRSYQLYRENVGLFGISTNLKAGLGNNFLMFIYQYYSHFPELSKIAEKEFYNLGYSKMWPVGGKRFQHLAKVVGFKNAMKLKASFRKS